jgi:xanthine dehydrogenase YagS FAD-binding subunit
VGSCDHPARRAEPGRRRIIQGVGHTLSEERLSIAASGRILTQTLDTYKLPTIADVPEMVVVLLDIPDRALDEPRAPRGSANPADRPECRGDLERDRDATGADVRSLPVSREEMLRALNEARERERKLATSYSLTPSRMRRRARERFARARRRHRARAAAALEARRDRHARRRARRRPARRAGDDDRRRHDARRARGRPGDPAALREACSLAASPQLRSMGTIGGNLLQATRCWYWRLRYPCYLHGGDVCHARQGAHREHAIFGNERCASAHPSDPAAALLALGATVRTDRRSFPIAELYRLPTDENRDVTALEPGELILELDVPLPEGSTYVKAMERNRFSFALVGVAAARDGGETRLALAGVAPVPWLLAGQDELDRATPLPGTAYKVDLARPLVRRALEALA